MEVSKFEDHADSGASNSPDAEYDIEIFMSPLREVSGILNVCLCSYLAYLHWLINLLTPSRYF
jgi:hypothetical protein